ncbi:MAG: DUF2752 domain-containing protein [Chitinophagales bacterium]
MTGWLETHMFRCPSVTWFGMECPGCGMQRSLIFLLKGQFLDSFLMYPPLLPLLGMVIYLALHLLFSFRSGAKILQYMFVGNAVLVFLNYTLRIFFSYS